MKHNLYELTQTDGQYCKSLQYHAEKGVNEDKKRFVTSLK